MLFNRPDELVNHIVFQWIDEYPLKMISALDVACSSKPARERFLTLMRCSKLDTPYRIEAIHGLEMLQWLNIRQFKMTVVKMNASMLPSLCGDISGYRFFEHIVTLYIECKDNSVVIESDCLISLLARFTKLEKLNINEWVTISENNLAAIFQHLPHTLEHFDLTHSAIAPDRLLQLIVAHGSALEELVLDCVKVSHQHIMHLSQSCHNVRFLEIKNITSDHDASIFELIVANKATLRALYLTSQALLDTMYQNLFRSCTQLEVFRYSNIMDLHDNSTILFINALTYCSKLKGATIFPDCVLLYNRNKFLSIKVPVSPEDLATVLTKVAPLQKLTVLRIDDILHTVPTIVRYHGRTLEKLGVAVDIATSGISTLFAGAPCLKHLNVTIPTNTPVSHIIHSRLLNEFGNKVTMLIISANVNITDEVILHCLRACPMVKDLTISSCPQVTDQALHYISSHAICLQSLDMYYVNFSAHGLSHFLIARQGTLEDVTLPTHIKKDDVLAILSSKLADNKPLFVKLKRVLQYN